MILAISMILILIIFCWMKNHMKIFKVIMLSYKTPCFSKPVRIIFDEVDGYIRKYDKNKHLALFHPETFKAIVSKIKYLIMFKCNISYVISQKNMKITIDWDNDLP